MRKNLKFSGDFGIQNVQVSLQFEWSKSIDWEAASKEGQSYDKLRKSFPSGTLFLQNPAEYLFNKNGFLKRCDGSNEKGNMM